MYQIIAGLTLNSHIQKLRYDVRYRVKEKGKKAGVSTLRQSPV
jgi:hypothetical protein